MLRLHIVRALILSVNGNGQLLFESLTRSSGVNGFECIWAQSTKYYMKVCERVDG